MLTTRVTLEAQALTNKEIDAFLADPARLHVELNDDLCPERLEAGMSAADLSWVLMDVALRISAQAWGVAGAAQVWEACAGALDGAEDVDSAVQVLMDVTDIPEKRDS